MEGVTYGMKLTPEFLAKRAIVRGSKATQAFALHKILMSWVEIAAEVTAPLPLLPEVINTGFKVLESGIGLDREKHVGAVLFFRGGGIVVLGPGDDENFEGYTEDERSVKITVG